MKAESPALAGQRETCQEERKSGQTQAFNFLPVFCCSSSVLVAGFVFADSCLVWDPFRISLQNGAVMFVCLYIFVADVQLSCLPLRVRVLAHFQTRAVRFLPSVVGTRTVSVSGSSIPVQNIWGLRFFSQFLITVVIHPWLADLQRVLKPESHRGQPAVPEDSICIFFLSFLLSILPQISASCSL